VHIGRYEVVKALKGGGMGSVTLCRAPDGDLVVLKRPHAVDPEAAVRLRDEARVGARLIHPGIVDTLDLFEHDDRPVLVVAYVEGLPLETLRRIGPLPVPVVARIGRQIADALDAIHSADDEHERPLHILHRDVTPGNILLGSDGDAKLIDLGIARFSERQAEHTQDGFLRGTMRYLAPELLEGGGYTTATDLWALGMVLWEAALGRFAYRGESDREVLAGIVMGQPMELHDGEAGLDPKLHEAIAPLLMRMPFERTANAAEAAARFAQIEDDYADTVTLAREALQDFLARKEASVELPVLGAGGGLGRPALGADGFEDVVTHVESADDHDDGHGVARELSDGDEAIAFGDNPTVALRRQPRQRADDDGVAREPSDPLEPQETAAIPAPVRFSSLGQASSLEEPSQHADFAGASEEDTLVNLSTPAVAAPPADSDDVPLGDTAQRVAEVRDALLALASEEGDPIYPSAGGEDGDTLSTSNPVPPDAFRSSIADRAAEFEEGVSLVTHAPAPQLDDDDVEEMHTIDGLHPARGGGPIEVTLRSPPPTEGAPAKSKRGKRKQKHGSKKKKKGSSGASASWDAIASVKAGSDARSHVHVRTGGDDDDDPTGTRPVARLKVVRKTPEQLARDRAARPAPEPGVSNQAPARQRVDIDALPSARPRPRVETPDLGGPSPFSGPSAASPATAAPVAPDRRGPPIGQEPTAVDAYPPVQPDPDDGGQPGDSPGELRMDTAVGAKITDLPPPAAPLRPLGPDVRTEPLFHDEDAAVEAARVVDKSPAFGGGETVSLKDIASLLDDD